MSYLTKGHVRTLFYLESQTVPVKKQRTSVSSSDIIQDNRREFYMMLQKRNEKERGVCEKSIMMSESARCFTTNK